jgi:parvulin-like peptidyl-prolyl isomerase
MPLPFAVATIGSAALFAAGIAAAAELPPDVLARSSRATLTRADFEAELESVPPELRSEFVANRVRLGKLVNSMLEAKTLAADARANGLDKDPVMERRTALAVDRVLAHARADQIEREAGAAFDLRRDEFANRARELYALDKTKHRLPEQIRAAHILVRTDRRGKEEALKLAQDIRAKAVAGGADFAALAREFSEDQTARTNGGDLGWFAATRMDPAFSAGAFALRKAGEVSEPVLSSSGYHIIRLDARKPAELQPFDAVKESIVAEIRREYITEKKNAATNDIFGDPTLQVNQPAIDALTARVDADVLRKAGATPAK